MEHLDAPAVPAARSAIHRRLASAIVAGIVAVGVSVGIGGGVAACDALDVPSVGVERCVVAGGQPEIDAGNVVRYDALSSATVHWIAGHRTTHGGTFRPLTALEFGDRVTYRGATYEIVAYELVDRTRPDPVIAWIDSTERSLVLQTSAFGNHVHVWRALPVRPRVDPDAAEAHAPAGRIGVADPVVASQAAPAGDVVGDLAVAVAAGLASHAVGG